MKSITDIENSITTNLRALLIGEKVNVDGGICYLSDKGKYVIDNIKYITFYDYCDFEYDIATYKIIVEILTLKGNKTSNFEKQFVLY